MMDIFQTLKGIDGCYYVIKDSKLVKIIKTECNEKWQTTTGGWIKFFLEDGTIYSIGNLEE